MCGVKNWKVRSPVIGGCPFDVVWWAWTPAIVVTTLQTGNTNLITKNNQKIPIQDILQNTWLGILKTTKVIKDKKTLRNTLLIGT